MLPNPPLARWQHTPYPYTVPAITRPRSTVTEPRTCVNPLLHSYRLSLHSLRSWVRAGHSMANPPRWVTVLAAVSGDGFILASSFSIGSNGDLL